jgi:hypothetical protein
MKRTHNEIACKNSKSSYEKKYSKIKIAGLCVFVLLGIKTSAQLKGDHLVGDFGLSAGTQAPPTIIAALPLYGYNASRLRNSDGDVVNSSPDIGAFLIGVGGSLVTNFKILNANYGASILIAFISNRIEGNIIQSKSSLGFTDMYAQPLQLGWHTKRADYSAAMEFISPLENMNSVEPKIKGWACGAMSSQVVQQYILIKKRHLIFPRSCFTRCIARRKTLQ